jgi:serine/threonine protein kinase
LNKTFAKLAAICSSLEFEVQRISKDTPVMQINKTFSHYRILSQIGEGGMGSVYLADDLKHSRRVAIKVMKADSELLSVMVGFSVKLR